LKKLEENKSTQLLILLLCFMVALGFRLVNLGGNALTDGEAVIALQALRLAEGTRTVVGSQLSALSLTSISFFLFDSNNLLARFWPALFGALIVLIPFLFRNRIGWLTALISSLFLSISPEMVSLSRWLGSSMSAMVFLLLGLGFAYIKKPVLFGFCLAMGLMSGPGFWMGLLIIGLSGLISFFLFKINNSLEMPSQLKDGGFWRSSGIAFGATLLIVGTGFFRTPYSLSGVFSGLFEFVNGFTQPYSTSRVLIVLALLVYSSGALIFGIWGSVQGLIKKDLASSFLLVWWFLGLILIVLYPKSTPADIIWVTFPMWILAARVFTKVLNPPEGGKAAVFITAIIVIVVSAFMMLILRAILQYGPGQVEQNNYLIALLGGVILLVALILVVSFGWSEKAAITGLLIGSMIVVCISLISVSVNSAGINSERSQELWFPDEKVYSSRWLEKSIDDVTEWNSRRDSAIDIVISGINTPAMEWVMAPYENVEFASSLSPQSQPGILITPIDSIPEISNSYRGQDLVWSSRALWDILTPNQFLKWMITREVSENSHDIIFWVRTDLMPDAQFTE
jgi:hypothetical protein